MRRAAISLILVALTFIMSDRALSEGAEDARDRLCGWYKLTTGNRLIPVFKIDRTYYPAVVFFLLAICSTSFGQLVHSGSGADAAAIQAIVDTYRSDLGTECNLI